MEGLGVTAGNEIDGLRQILGGKRVLVTGHTGFKGAWLCLWLSRLGAQVAGFSIDVPTTPSLYEAARITPILAEDRRGDVTDPVALRDIIESFRPDAIFHLAAQSLVQEGFRNPVTTIGTNVMGTVTLLEILRQYESQCAVVIVTSDKCYENTGQVWGYRECDRLGGSDPYSASKGMAEIATSSYRSSYFPPDRLEEHGIAIATARSGNVLGGGDWSQDRIAVDLIKGFAKGEPVVLRNPHAVRPWQHVLEPLHGYLVLASHLLSRAAHPFCTAWNFGPSPVQSVSVGALAAMVATAWGDSAKLARADVADAKTEAAFLRLAIDKSITGLKWAPRWDPLQTVNRTVGWYRHFLEQGVDPFVLCELDLEAYEQIAD